MMMMNIKQKKIKIELRIKLNYNIYNEQDIYTNMALVVQSVGNFIQCIPNQWIVLFTHYLNLGLYLLFSENRNYLVLAIHWFGKHYLNSNCFSVIIIHLSVGKEW